MKLIKIKRDNQAALNKPDQFLCIPKEVGRRYFVGYFFQSAEYNDYYTFDETGTIVTKNDLSEIYLITPEN